MDYITPSASAKINNLSRGYVCKLAPTIPGAKQDKFSRTWKIPADWRHTPGKRGPKRADPTRHKTGPKAR